MEVRATAPPRRTAPTQRPRLPHVGTVRRRGSLVHHTSRVLGVGCAGVRSDPRLLASTATACNELCHDIAATMGWDLLSVVTQPEVVCAALHYCPAPAPPAPPAPDAAVPVPANLTDKSGEKAWPAWQKTTGAGSILHLTDIHLVSSPRRPAPRRPCVRSRRTAAHGTPTAARCSAQDLGYTVGAAVDCGLPLCCRNDSGTGNATTHAAGYWGDIRTGKGSGCDTPWQTLESAVTTAAKQHNFDFVIYTGDSPAHYVWETTADEVLEVSDKIAGLLNSAFPDTPVFSAIGNHESSPVNQFKGPGADGDAWLYDGLAAAWAHNLPDQALKTLRYGGYYAARARPGLFVISLNLNLFQSGDFWLWANDSDVASQLPWLRDTLRQVRALGEKAIIIGHEPGLMAPFDGYFNAIVDEFSDVIADQFRGHTHTEDVCVVRNATGAPMHSMYIAGSITTYSLQNAGFQVYTFDRALPRANLVDDYAQYWLDVEAANADNSTVPAAWTTPRFWAREHYGITDAALSPASFEGLAARLGSNATLAADWIRARYKGVGGDQDSVEADACYLSSCHRGSFDNCTGVRGAWEARVAGSC